MFKLITKDGTKTMLYNVNSTVIPNMKPYGFFSLHRTSTSFYFFLTQYAISSRAQAEKNSWALYFRASWRFQLNFSRQN